MNKKLIVFEIDGILLNNKTSSFKEILALLGKGEEAEEIDREYQKRKFTGPWGLEQLTRLYEGFSEEKLKETADKYCRENLAQGAKECLEELKNKGCIIGVLSSNPQFICDALAQALSLDFAEGTRFEFKDGICTGNIQRRVDRYIKAEILGRNINERSLVKEDVIVVGNSITAIPMTELAGNFIAFLPKDEAAREKANQIAENFSQLREKLP